MAEPSKSTQDASQRPKIICFGASITDYSFQPETYGFGAALRDHFQGIAEVINRGMAF
jgi:hypothetical protein